jgi:alpha-glucosidase
LRLDVYPGPDCHGEVYADDGISFAYRRGVSLRQRFACTAAPGGLTIEIGAPQGRFTPWWTTLDLVIHDAGPDLRFDPRSGVSRARYDAGNRTLSGEIAAPRKAITLTLAEGVR